MVILRILSICLMNLLYVGIVYKAKLVFDLLFFRFNLNFPKSLEALEDIVSKYHINPILQ